jgi:hypothetical protein
MLFEGGYTYSNFLMNMIGVFAFVVWFWLVGMSLSLLK